MAEIQPPRVALLFVLCLSSMGVVGCSTAPPMVPPDISGGMLIGSSQEAVSQGTVSRGTVSRGTVEAEDGLEIAYDDRGSGAIALVFVHDWASDRSLWREQLDVLAQNYRVVSLDLGGHGASGRWREAWYLQDLAGDVQAVVEQLGLERVILVGHSMGTTVSLEAARHLGARMEGVVCVDSLYNAEITITDKMVESMSVAFENAYQETMGHFVHSAFPRGSDPQLIASIQERLKASDPEVALQLLRDIPNMELTALLSGAGVPVRCINPGHSPTRTEINQRYADFDVVVLDDVGHFLMLEDPAAFNKALVEVVSRLTEASDTL